MGHLVLGVQGGQATTPYFSACHSSIPRSCGIRASEICSLDDQGRNTYATSCSAPNRYSHCRGIRDRKSPGGQGGDAVATSGSPGSCGRIAERLRIFAFSFFFATDMYGRYPDSDGPRRMRHPFSHYRGLGIRILVVLPSGCRHSAVNNNGKCSKPRRTLGTANTSTLSDYKTPQNDHVTAAGVGCLPAPIPCSRVCQHRCGAWCCHGNPQDGRCRRNTIREMAANAGGIAGAIAAHSPANTTGSLCSSSVSSLSASPVPSVGQPLSSPERSPVALPGK